MSVHLIKLAVGVDEAAQIPVYQARRLRPFGTQSVVPVHTRNQPRRADEVLDGGSLYWVVRGVVRCRQRVQGFDGGVDGEGNPFCLILVDPTLVPTVPMPRRPFQGWRYLEPEAAPPDLAAAGGETGMPAELVAELRELGLL